MSNDKIVQFLNFFPLLCTTLPLALSTLCYQIHIYFCQRLIVWKYEFAYIFSSVVFMSLTKLMKLKLKEMKPAYVTKFLHHYL